MQFDLQRFATTEAESGATHYITVSGTNYASYDFNIAKSTTLSFTLDGGATEYTFQANASAASTGTISIDATDGALLVYLTAGTLLNLDKDNFLSTTGRSITFQNTQWTCKVLEADTNFQFSMVTGNPPRCIPFVPSCA